MQCDATRRDATRRDDDDPAIDARERELATPHSCLVAPIIYRVLVVAVAAATAEATVGVCVRRERERGSRLISGGSL